MRAGILTGVLLVSFMATGCGPREAPAPTGDTAAPTAATPAPAPAASAPEPQPVAGAQPVTVDNFIRAESDSYLDSMAKDAGGLGKLLHRREPASIDHQTVIRLNRDTLYSSAVVDLDAGPVTVTLPDTGGRFQSLEVINQDHYAWTEYGAGPHTIDRAKAGTRYAVLGIRTLVDPNDPKDVAAVHALQDAITVSQKNPGTLELPAWDPVSRKKVRDSLLVLGSTIGDFNHAFGAKDQVDPVRHLIATAAAWGGNPDKDAVYLNITPPQNDGKNVYAINVKDVPVDAFWSVSVYNADGYYEKNAANAYTVNNLTAKKEADGSVRIQFGGCDGNVPNCLPVVAGWNYTVRLYRPRKEILDGTWTFPQPQPVT